MADTSSVVGFTGHRPPRAGLTYSHSGPVDRAVVGYIRDFLRQHQAAQAYVGGALGFDTLAARACYLEQVPYHVFVPFVGQESKWPREAQTRYCTMLSHASQVTVISEGGYSVAKMHTRNEAIVIASDILVAYWDGSPGGTSHTVEVANRLGVQVVNLYAPAT